MTTPRLDLSQTEVLAHRRRAGALDERLPPGRSSLERAAWAGLQDSMPRAALLSIHARVAGTEPSTWEDASLVQVWGPRFSAYVVAARDRAVFTLGRLPADAKGLRRAENTAARLHAFLDGRRMRYDEAGRGIGVHPNALRYAAPTGTVLMRWEGARLPVIWTVPRPEIDPREARLELARRYLHVFGPTTPAAFAKWAGIGAAEGRAAFEALAGEVLAVRTPVGDGWILTSDERSFRAAPSPQRRLGSSRAATRTSCSTGSIASFWSPTKAGVASCGLRASGPARCWSGAKSSGPGDARTQSWRSKRGDASPLRNGEPSRRRPNPFRCQA